MVTNSDAAAPDAVVSPMASWPLMPFGAGVPAATTSSGVPSTQVARVTG